jgi:hypothetical protein
MEHQCPEAVRAETGRVRADAEKMLAGLRADAVRDRDELRADLRARAERTEQLADAYRDELAQLRAETSYLADTTAVSKTPRPASRPRRRDQTDCERCDAVGAALPAGWGLLLPRLLAAALTGRSESHDGCPYDVERLRYWART